MPQNNDQALGIWRTAAKSVNAAASALLSGTQRMLERQAEISREILAEYANAAKRIETAEDAHALLAVQSRLTGVQLEKAADWWAALYAEAGVAQRDLLRNAQAAALGLAENLSLTLDRAAQASGAAPVMSAMKLVVDATRSSYRTSTVAGAADPDARHDSGRPAAQASADRQASG